MQGPGDGRVTGALSNLIVFWGLGKLSCCVLRLKRYLNFRHWNFRELYDILGGYSVLMHGYDEITLRCCHTFGYTFSLTFGESFTEFFLVFFFQRHVTHLPVSPLRGILVAPGFVYLYLYSISK